MRYPIFSPASRTLVLLAVIVSVTGCATKQDIRDLQAGITEELRRVSTEQEALREEIRQQSALAQDSTSRELTDIRGSLLMTLGRIDDRLGQIEELVGQNSLGISTMRDQMEALRRGGVSTAPSGAGDPAQTASGTLSSGTGEADALYNAAVTQFNRGSLSAARLAFQQFLTQFPSHELAPDAQYYLADIQVQEGNLEEAVEAFSAIRELFPTSDRVPDALYRVGVLQIELGNEAEARRALELVVNTYPDHRAALAARDRLASLGGVPS